MCKLTEFIACQRELGEQHQTRFSSLCLLYEFDVGGDIGRNDITHIDRPDGFVLDNGDGQGWGGSHPAILCGPMRAGRLLRTVARYGQLLEMLSPRHQPLSGPHVFEQLQGRQGVKVRLGQPAREFGAGSLFTEHNTLVAPLHVLRRRTCDELPEEEVHHSWTHGLHGAAHAVCGSGSVVHAAILFEHIFENKA